jgi:hypothetical protein
LWNEITVPSREIGFTVVVAPYAKANAIQVVKDTQVPFHCILRIPTGSERKSDDQMIQQMKKKVSSTGTETELVLCSYSFQKYLSTVVLK